MMAGQLVVVLGGGAATLVCHTLGHCSPVSPGSPDLMTRSLGGTEGAGETACFLPEGTLEAEGISCPQAVGTQELGRGMLSAVRTRRRSHWTVGVAA